MKLVRIAFAIAILGIVPRASLAAVIDPGDVVVTGSIPTGIFTYTSKALLYDHNGTFKQELLSIPNRVITSVATSPSGVVYLVTGTNFVTFDRNGVSTTVPGGGGDLDSLSFGADGRFYAGTHLGVEIQEFASNGSLLRHIPLPQGSNAFGLDLASDQCTLYSVDGSGVGRTNVCSTGPVPFAVSSTGGGDLRVLPDGGFVVAANQVTILDSTGNVVRAFPYLTNSVALDTTAGTAWIYSGGLRKIDLLSGTTLVGPINTGGIGVDAIGVVGEPRAALAASLTSVPTLSPLVIALLASLLASVAVIRLRS